MTQDKRMYHATIRTVENLELVAKRSSEDGEPIKDREAQEALKALLTLEWFGNFDVQIQRTIEEAQERIAEASRYENLEELREAVEKKRM